MVIQHNMTAMNAGRMLGVTTGQQAKQSEKLASGYKINRAGDDAAGLKISEKMRSQIRGLNKASTNAQDGVSLIQTAEGALNEAHSILQRMNELTVQGANDTNEAIDRDAINQELKALTEELDRIASTTQFNKQNLLDGTFNYKKLQIGANTNQKMDIKIGAMNATAIGLNDAVTVVEGTRISTTVSTVAVETSVTRYTYGSSGTEYSTLASASAALSTARDGLTSTSDRITAITSDSTGTAFTAGNSKWAVDGTSTLYNTSASARGVASAAYSTENAALSTATVGSTITTVTTKTSKVGYTYEGAGTNYSTLLSASAALSTARTDLTSTSDRITAITSDSTGTAFTAGNSKWAVDGTSTLYNTSASARGVASAAYSIENAALSTATATSALSTVSNTSTTSVTTSIPGTSVSVTAPTVSSYEKAQATLSKIQAAINAVSEQRSALGALQNRLEHTIANLDNVAENTQAAESRIRDTDMAEEMVEYSKNQILAQAGQSMLAQANQSTQGVLSLLQ